MLSKSQKGKVEFMVHYVALINRLDLKFSPHKSFHHPLLKLFSPTTTQNQLGTLAKLILCKLLYTGDFQSGEKHFSFIRHFIFIFAFHSSSTNTKKLVSLYIEAWGLATGFCSVLHKMLQLRFSLWSILLFLLCSNFIIIILVRVLIPSVVIHFHILHAK